MRIVPINCITKETTLAKSLYNSSGNVLLRKGALITASLIEKIKAADINTIYIDDGYSDVEIEEVIKPEVKHAAVKTIKKAFESIKHDLEQNLHTNTQLQDKLQLKLMNSYVDKLKGISDLIIEDIMASHNLLINIVDIKHISDYTYEHSLNVAVLSLIIGMELRYKRQDLLYLFMGAILHDLGKVFIESEILDSGDNMTENQIIKYNQHPKLGYDYIKENYGISATSKIVILQHHEHFDGSGTPHGTHEEAIHKFARIVAICDTYDKLTSDSKNSPAVPANEAIEYIMGSAGTKFDFDIVSVFVRKINPYPIGTLIDLSNKKTAVVIGTNFNYPLRPIVQVLSLTDGIVNKLEVIDLIQVTDVTIAEIRYTDL